MNMAPTLIALVASTAAMASMSLVARRLGGQIGLVLKLVVVGICLSVFMHAGLEVAQVMGLFDHGMLMVLMDVLVTAGSVAFFAAGVFGLRALR